MKFKDKLDNINACQEAIDWVKDKGVNKSWQTCNRGDWMIWYVFHQRELLGLEDMRLITKAKVECAKLVKHLMKDKRSLNALDVAERFGNNEATRDELDAAYDAAAYAAYDAAAYAAYDDADAAADAAAYAAAYDAADAAAADDARNETLSKCADICREVFKDIIL